MIQSDELNTTADYCLSVCLSVSGSVEGDPQCPEALTFPDSSFSHQPFYRYSNSPLTSPCDPYSSASSSAGPPGASHIHTQVRSLQQLQYKQQLLQMF